MMYKRAQILLFLAFFALLPSRPSMAISRDGLHSVISYAIPVTAAISVFYGFPVIPVCVTAYCGYQGHRYFTHTPDATTAVNPATESYAKLIKLQIGLTIFSDIVKIILDPLVKPIADRMFGGFQHPKLLQGDKSATYVVRDRLQLCNTSAAAVLKMPPWNAFDLCKKTKSLTRIDQLIYAPETKSEIKHFQDLVLSRARHREGLPNLFLYGPAGTGKTALAEALASSLGFNFQRLSGSQMTKDTQGVSQFSDAIRWAEMESLFPGEALQDTRPVMFFIDEIEHFSRSRNHEKMASLEYQVLAEFLALINNSGSKKYLIVAASNMPDKSKIDEAFADRFDQSIKIDVPGIDERIQLFALYLKHRSSQLLAKDFQDFAFETNGFSARAIKVTCDNTIAQYPAKENILESINRTKRKRQDFGLLN